jgi:prephenate dehydrogenase
VTAAPVVFERLVVVGFGLIGASVARAAKARGVARRIVAADRPRVLGGDVVRTIADESVDATDPRALEECAKTADLVVLAAPVAVIETLAAELGGVCRLLTDCGSTKRSIARAATRPGRTHHFVPGHPMAGDPRGGAEHARDDLFVGRSWILCPERSGAADVEAVGAFVQALGARPVLMSSEAHDRAVAVTSHVPQLFANVLAVLAEERAAEGAAGPAFASATRVAGGSEAMWRDILAANADEIATALRTVAGRLDAIAGALSETPPRLDEALADFERARSVKRRPPA